MILSFLTASATEQRSCREKRGARNVADRLSLSDLISTGDFDEIDNVDEQIAMFACLLAFLVVMFLTVLGGLACVIVGTVYLWSRLSLQHGLSSI